MTPFGDAVMYAGLYRVGLKKLTPPRMRPMAFAMAYQISNFSGAVALNLEDLFKNVYPGLVTVNDQMIFVSGMKGPTIYLILSSRLVLLCLLAEATPPEEDSFYFLNEPVASARLLQGKKFSGTRQLLVVSWVIVVVAFVLVYKYVENVTVIDPDDPDEEDDAGLTLAIPADVQQQIDTYKAEVAAAGGQEAFVTAAVENSEFTTPCGRCCARRRANNRKYFLVPTPLRESGIRAYFSGMASAARFRSFWMVTAFYISSFFVSKQWTFSSLVMTKFLERNYGEGLPIMGIVSINYLGCTFMPMIVAAFTGMRNPWQVMMIGLWTMALSPIFVIFGAGPDANAADGMMGCFVWQWVLTVGECLWSPRAYAWSASLAPVGYEGVFVALSSVKDLLLKPIGSMMAGYLNNHYNPNCKSCRNDVGHFCDTKSTDPTVVGFGCAAVSGAIVTECESPAVGWPVDEFALTEFCPSSCRDCPGWLELSDPVGMWTFVLWWSIMSPVAIWLFLPFIQGNGDKSTHYNLFKLNLGRLWDCFMPGREGVAGSDNLLLSGGKPGKMIGNYNPSGNHKNTLACPAGTELVILDDTGADWLLAKNPKTGEEGWVPRSGVSPFNEKDAGYTPPVTPVKSSEEAGYVPPKLDLEETQHSPLSAEATAPLPGEPGGPEQLL